MSWCFVRVVYGEEEVVREEIMTGLVGGAYHDNGC